MELERAHADEHTAANSAEGSAPVSPSPQEKSATTQVQSSEPWHKTWNPLNLSATATSEYDSIFGAYCCCCNSNLIYCLYVYFCTAKHLFLPTIPMLVFLGNPTDRPTGLYSLLYYTVIGGMIAHSLIFFHADLTFFKKDRIHATFLKVLLLSEQRRELKVFKFIFLFLQVAYVGIIFYVSFVGVPEVYKACQANNQSNCDEFKRPPDSPMSTSINFWILLATWGYACYKVLTYNDCYNGQMLPKKEFMAKHYPDEFKMAKERFPKALADKKKDESFFGRVKAFFKKLNELDFGDKENEKDVIFEPNIPIRPIYSKCTWFFTDTSETLRNIMLVCGRVAVLWQQHQSQLDPSKFSPSMKISEFLTSAHAAIDDQLTDDSLQWECVVACSLLFVLACRLLFRMRSHVVCRHIHDMTIADVVKVNAYFNTGLLSVSKGKKSPEGEAAV